MKTIRTLLLSGAAFALAAQAGQNFNIKFPFRTQAGDMPAGRYRSDVTSSGATQFLTLRNAETGSTVILVPTNPLRNVRGTEQPRMEFACTDAGCDLKRLWRTESDGYELRQRKLTPSEKERLATVRTERVAAE